MRKQQCWIEEGGDVAWCNEGVETWVASASNVDVGGSNNATMRDEATVSGAKSSGVSDTFCCSFLQWCWHRPG